MTGAMYEDGTSGADKLDDAVMPGKIFTYEWVVRETFAPTPDDENCLPWAYHSHHFSTRDTDTGLTGLFLTCKPGETYIRLLDEFPKHPTSRSTNCMLRHVLIIGGA